MLTRGDIHRDFETKTDIGVARRGPLHIRSSIFGTDTGSPQPRRPTQDSFAPGKKAIFIPVASLIHVSVLAGFVNQAKSTGPIMRSTSGTSKGLLID